jgi:hypothetical protein
MTDPIKPVGETQDDNPEVSFERRDVNVFQITAFGIGLLLSCIVVVFAMWALFHFLAQRENDKNTPLPKGMAAERQYVPPEPRLSGVRVENGQVSPHPVYPRVELKELQDDEDAILSNYGWVDPAHGTVRIPIDQAIDIVAKKGLPSKPSPAGTDNDGYRTIPSVASSGRTLEKISQ